MNITTLVEKIHFAQLTWRCCTKKSFNERLNIGTLASPYTILLCIGQPIASSPRIVLSCRVLTDSIYFRILKYGATFSNRQKSDLNLDLLWLQIGRKLPEHALFFLLSVINAGCLYLLKLALSAVWLFQYNWEQVTIRKEMLLH